MKNNTEISEAMTIKLENDLPEMPEFISGIRRAPDRDSGLSKNKPKLPWLWKSTSGESSCFLSKRFGFSKEEQPWKHKDI